MSARNERWRGSGRGRGAAAAPAPAAAPTPSGLFREAEALQQRAERRSGQEALQAYEQAVGKYRQALDAGLQGAERSEALFGLAECLQMWANTGLEVTRSLPDDQLTLAAEQQAASSACGLYEQSVASYQQVQEPSGSLRTDAAVNCGNTLCAWAEAAGPTTSLPLFERAVDAYRVALAQEEDALTWGNLADALVQQGEAQLSAGNTVAGEAAFQEALQAYARSCSMTDSSSGDDLPGLLCNWGSGLLTTSGYAQVPEARAALLEEAAQRLRNAVQFSRGDPAPHNVLGDVLLAQAELAGPGPASLAALAAAAQEGYGAALTISRYDTDALVGLAEVATVAGKQAAQAGAQAAALRHCTEARGYYASALQHPTKLGSLSERRDVRYNFACACALAGCHDEARSMLEQLAAAGALKAGDVASDEDLAQYRGHDWFQAILAQLPAS